MIMLACVFFVILYLIFELTEAERRKPYIIHGFMGYPSLYPPPGISVLQNTMIREGWPLGIFFYEDLRGKIKKEKEK